MYQKYVYLRDKAGVTDYKVSKETGIPNSFFCDWKKGLYQPKVDRLTKISDFFCVSLEYWREQDGNH